MNWELFALSDGMPPLIPVTEINSKSLNKIKRWVFLNFRSLKRKVDHWEWMKFSNNAWIDNDKYQLSHWGKAKDKEMPYPFEKVNYKVEIVEFTDKEYEEYLKDLNPGWTKEETQYLWNLCWQYDLWFIVIQDRYDYEGKDWTVEEIKNRYYSCAKKILEIREEKEHPIVTRPYNFEYEMRWKHNLEKLFLRTKAQHESEKKIVEDIWKID